MGRKNLSDAMKNRLLEKNAYACCVCKQFGVGLNFHHLDGDSSNTVDENIAVLCVQEHDAHHRPNQYTASKHLDLSVDKLTKYKLDWESFVSECKKDSPNVLATINVYGAIDNIVGMKIVFQWTNGKIAFERTYQLLDKPMDAWIDMALEEVLRLGKNIKVALIDEPLPIEYCEIHRNSISRTIDECVAIMLTNDDWEDEALATIYLNPLQPSFALTIFYKSKEPIYSVFAHKCGNSLHLLDYKKEERLHWSKRSSKSTQVTNLINDLLSKWHIKKIIIGTGDDNNPTIINNLVLPEIWEC